MRSFVLALAALAFATTASAAPGGPPYKLDAMASVTTARGNSPSRATARCAAEALPRSQNGPLREARHAGFFARMGASHWLTDTAVLNARGPTRPP